MELGRVVGQVIATVRDSSLPHGSLLLVEIMGADRSFNGSNHVAYDSIGSGEGEWVLLSRGSSARQGMPEGAPVDLRIVGVVDQVTTGNTALYKKNEQ